MSILIKGMEKPESCESCPFEDFGGCMFRVQKGDCPLVPVPTPHGRLIDADALKEEWTEAEERMGADTVIKLSLKDFITYGCVYDLDNAPTIIEAEDNRDD